MIIIFFFICLLHLILELRNAIPIISYQPKTASLSSPPFSVIVAARNESKNLRELLPALLEQDYPNFEVIISLDRCSDESTEILKKWQRDYPNLKTIDIQDLPTNHDGKKNALEKGIDVAKSEWLLFTDADCIPAGKGWIQEFAKEATAETDIILGIGMYRKAPGILNKLIRYESFQTAVQYIGSAIRLKPYMGVGRNLAYRKSLFKNSTGFDQIKTIRGGDDDLFVQKNANKKNTKVVLSPNSLTYSRTKRTLKAYYAQKLRHLSVGKYYRSHHKLTLSVRSILHLLVWMSFLYLIFENPTDHFVWIFFGCMMLLKGLIFSKVASKIGESIGIFSMPVTDFLYATMLPLIGVKATLVKRIKWK